MKKKKGKKGDELNFNPANYDYMDNMRLEGWIWEMIRRSHGYNSLYRELHDLISIERKGEPFDYDTEREEYSAYTDRITDIGLEPLRQNYETHEHRNYTPLCEECRKKGLSLPPINSPPLIRSSHFIYCFDRSHRSCFFYGIPDPAMGYTKLGIRPTIERLTHLKCKSFHDLKEIPDWIFTSNLSVLDFLSPSGIPEDTVFVGIRKDTKISDIEKNFMSIIKDHLKPKSSRRRDEKWKYYLIVYDLVKDGMSYSEITDLLINVYSDNKNIFDVRNIENYYKNSLFLIDGGYKKLI